MRRSNENAAGQNRLVGGWGGVAPSRANVHRPRGIDDVASALAKMPSSSFASGLIARGAGCSYGDAAQIDGGEVLDMTGLDGVLEIEPERLTVTVQAGISLAALMSRLAREGMTLPVLPGTRHVTVGGAIASDIHGKSHHRDGSFSRHVRSMALCVPGGELLRVSPEQERGVFEATLGGMGLTGVIAEATLSIEPLLSAWVAADTERTDSLDQTLQTLCGRERSRWSVAWLDLLADGAAMGRGIVSRADPWPRAGVAHGAEGGGGTLDLSQRPRVRIPRRMPSGTLQPSLIRAFNSARWHRAPRREYGRRIGLAGYLFPLDAIGSWSRLYGSQGLIQYQFVVPSGNEDQIVRCVELLRVRRVPVYLAVLKRFGPFGAGPLSFPIEGFTLALDMPGRAPGLRDALDELDDIVAACGGRVYLSKDIRLKKDLLPFMYPRLEEFRDIRARLDPEEVLRSDLARRLGL